MREKVEAMKKFYKENLQGKSVINEDLGIIIQFTSDGLGKITQNRWQCLLQSHPEPSKRIKTVTERVWLGLHS